MKIQLKFDNKTKKRLLLLIYALLVHLVLMILTSVKIPSVLGATPQQYPLDDITYAANAVGYSLATLSSCSTSGVNSDTSEAIDIGIGVSPGILIGRIEGDKVVGRVSVELKDTNYYASLIDEMLAGTARSADLKEVPIGDAPYLGQKETAKVAMITYCGVRCPVCAMLYTSILPILKEKYLETGQMILIYKHFPLGFNNPAEGQRYNIASCIQSRSGNQKFFDFTQSIYESMQKRFRY